MIDRLQLDGRFTLAQARFTNYDVQKRITMLSRRARGETEMSDGASVVSNLHGGFVLRDGVLRLSGLTFAVPGAVVRLDGTYALRTQAMDFTGDLLLDANARGNHDGHEGGAGEDLPAAVPRAQRRHQAADQGDRHARQAAVRPGREARAHPGD